MNALSPIMETFAATMAVASSEMRKLARDPVELLSRCIQPILWLVIFGQVFSRARAIPTGAIGYLDFMTPGVLAQSVLYGGIFYGISTLWERDLGITHKLLATPAPRAAFVLGKAVSSGVRGVVQAVVIYMLAIVMGIGLSWNPLHILGVLLAVMMGSAIFATLSLIVGCLVKTRERFMGINQLMTMPLFFASNAIYPIDIMPPWLQAIARINPLTYLVDALRELMLEGGVGVHTPAINFLVIGATFAVLATIATRLYPGLVR